MLKYFLEKYYIKTGGFYPFFKYCPTIYKYYFLNKRYFDTVGYCPNLKNPKTFNEKVRWLILNEKTDLKTKLTDKIHVKNWVNDKLGKGYCAELYGIWKEYKEIDFSTLPDKFAIKANHGWKMNLFVLNKENFSKTKSDYAKSTTEKWIQTNYFDFSLEPQYKNIEKRLFAEKLREMNNGNFDYDYQVHCFNGEPKLIEIMPPPLSVPFRGVRAIQFYDMKWNLMPFTYHWEYDENIIKKPKFIDEMCECAKELSKDFSYVRVDFGLDGDKVNFAEMTFSPSSAMIQFNWPKYDKELGDMIDLPNI